MGRLDDILERNRNPKGSRERWIWSMAIGLFLILILILTVFTDLGRHPEDVRPVDVAPSAPDHSRVHDVQLR